MAEEKRKYNILITGGTGLVGSHLADMLRKKEYTVSIFTRSKELSIDKSYYFWDPESGVIDAEAIDNADCIIHLAGANIGKSRWTSKRKKLLYDSRIEPIKQIYDHLKRNTHRTSLFITASATGYYGSTTTNNIYTEENPSGNDFTGNLCKDWETEADSIAELGIRTVKIRTGVVLSEHGGALDKMIIPVKLGIGSPLGKGSQYVPWIHIDDICSIYLHIINNNNIHGAINAVAPQHVTNRDLMLGLARQLSKPFFMPPVPGFLMKLFFGEMSAIILEGSRVSSAKIEQLGFNFQFPTLEKALAALNLK